MSASAVGLFGSGWAWLAKDKSGKLVLANTPNQDSPVTSGLTPLLGIDVWEHAYYLDYKNERPKFVEAFWNIVDWDDVNRRLEAIIK